MAFSCYLPNWVKLYIYKLHNTHSIPPLNLEELKEDKAVQFAAEVTNRFTAVYGQLIAGQLIAGQLSADS